MAPHSSTLSWRIPWTKKPGRLQSMGSWRVGHDWATSLSLFTFMHWRRKWQPIPVFLPGESQGWRSLVGCRLWGHRVRYDLSDLVAAKVSVPSCFLCPQLQSAVADHGSFCDHYWFLILLSDTLDSQIKKAIKKVSVWCKERGKERGPGVSKQNIYTRTECQAPSKVGRQGLRQAEWQEGNQNHLPLSIEVDMGAKMEAEPGC